NYQYAAIRLISIARGVLGLMDRIRWKIVGQALHFIGLLQAAADDVALPIDQGIDLVGKAAIALIPGEANIASAGTDPDLLAVPGEGCLPDAEMVAAGDHRDGFRGLISEI